MKIYQWKEIILYTTKVLASVGNRENGMYCYLNIRGCSEGMSTSCLKVNFAVGKWSNEKREHFIP